ncbi:MAG: class I SAM-dependent methyltransferase [Desulfobacterales bacterium]|nr:class I SAM-dependent methyltransferase [Desulfobacterales bacterium]
MKNKFRSLDNAGKELLVSSLMKNHFLNTPKAYFETYEGQRDYQSHLLSRLDSYREKYISWLDNAKALDGSKILEIGCGSGCSTVALAEQGAQVTAIDINENSLKTAIDRCKAYKLDVSIQKANAIDAVKMYSKQQFDFILFFAVLEHMTINERKIVMKATWDMLPEGGLWVISNTPNRLWYYDSHSSLLPFFHWLPDDIAFLYGVNSPLDYYRRLLSPGDDNAREEFIREGRGVSFHEFDLFMAPLDSLKIISCLPLYLRKKNILRDLIWRLMTEYKYESFLAKVGPHIHKGFYQPYLELIIQKE